MISIFIQAFETAEDNVSSYGFSSALVNQEGF